MGIVNMLLGLRQQAKDNAFRERTLDRLDAQQEFQNRIEEAKMNAGLMTNPNFRPVGSDGTYQAQMPGSSTLPTNAMQAIDALRNNAAPLGGPAADAHPFASPDQYHAQQPTPQPSTPDVSRVAMSVPDSVSTNAPVDPSRALSFGGRQYQALNPTDTGEQSRYGALNDALNQAQAGAKIREQFGVSAPQEMSSVFPSGYKLMPNEYGQVVTQMELDKRATSSAQAAADRQAKKDAADTQEKKDQQAFQAEQNRLNRENAVKVAGIRGASPSGGGSGQSNDAAVVAQAIIDGKQPPDTKGLYRNTLAVKAELARRGFDMSTAERDWRTVQKNLATLNGAQQVRLRQAVNFTYDSLDNIEQLYDKWQEVGRASGFKLLNRAALATMKNLPGEAGATAQTLEAQIADLTSELGTVYKGGNSSTDESLKPAAENLKADWNPLTFKTAMKNIRKNLQIRRNSIMNSGPVGVSDNSPYVPHSTQQSQIPTSSGGTVKLKAPDGSVRDVPADQADHYVQLGAKRI